MAGRPRKIKPIEIPEEIKIPIDAMTDKVPDSVSEILDKPVEAPTIPIEAEPIIPEPPRLKYGTERLTSGTAVSTQRLPNITGGVCEFCGAGLYDTKSDPQNLIEDWKVDPATQIGKCRHYNGVLIRCSYCPESANFAENIRHRKHVIHVSPYDPNKLVIVCDDQACATKHIAKFTS